MNQSSPTQNLDVTKTTGVFCETCGGMFFDQTAFLRRMSKLYIGSPQDIVFPVLAFVCRDCGTPLTSEEFMPPGMKDVESRLNPSPNESGAIKIEM